MVLAMLMYDLTPELNCKVNLNIGNATITYEV